MAISRNTQTDEELDDMTVADTVRQYINIQARDWIRRERRRVLPRVLRMIDAARADTQKPDVGRYVREAFLEGKVLPLPESPNVSD